MGPLNDFFVCPHTQHPTPNMYAKVAAIGRSASGCDPLGRERASRLALHGSQQHTNPAMPTSPIVVHSRRPVDQGRVLTNPNSSRSTVSTEEELSGSLTRWSASAAGMASAAGTGR